MNHMLSLSQHSVSMLHFQSHTHTISPSRYLSVSTWWCHAPLSKSLSKSHPYNITHMISPTCYLCLNTVVPCLIIKVYTRFIDYTPHPYDITHTISPICCLCLNMVVPCPTIKSHTHTISPI